MSGGLPGKLVSVAVAGLMLLAMSSVDQAADESVAEKPVQIKASDTWPGQRIEIEEKHGKRYINVVWSPKGQRLYAVYRYETPRTDFLGVPPPADKHPLFQFTNGYCGGVECLELSQPGPLKIVWGLIFGASDRWFSQEPGQRILALSPDGNSLALGLYERVVLLHTEPPQGAGPLSRWIIRDIPAALEAGWTDRHVRGVAFSPDGQRLAGVYAGQVAHVWEVATGKTVRTWKAWDETCNSLHCARFTADGKGLVVAGNYQRVAFWDIQTAKLTRVWELKNVYSWEGFDDVTCPVHDFELVQKNAGNYCIVGLASHPYGRFRPGRTEGQVLLLDAASGRQVYSRKVGGGVYGVAVSPDGGWFVTTEFVRSWQERPIQPPPRRPVMDHFDWPSPLRIWELETGKQLAVLEGHEKGVTDVAVSPDGRWIASCGWDGTIRVWEVPPSLSKRK